ncbi:helix-turn-helix transcriptional regulator [Mammaliicoccus stepanovicii]|uniref:Putative repressor, phage associated n=1 Tax=Mammaliicoccus stepanovicii TaxID=643214 RepID=A0A239ZU20_9STAP|nr:helix-turn-helix transcriptional regulator [Mammaliicoccus stepanovicii]PNZ77453.1 XRE family transcriptional regulator [Mammaliicoccus stepanovicii]GGI38997.1 transcriptional regulator [Mammaliicoccus stepanovicii]SNV74742.1 putative repressor, phage associated [Mammaliicoccus stepanovicii]
MVSENKLSEQISLLRTKNGWTQQKLADELQVSKQSISYWETGRKAPKMKKIEEMAKLFNVSVSYILDGKSNSTYNSTAETIAAHLDGELTEDELQKVLEYVDFIKHQSK